MRTVFIALLVACNGSGTTSGDSPDPDAAAASPDAAAARPDAPASSITCDGRTAQPIDSTWTVAVGAANRTARVHVPASYDPTRPTPIVINAHGRTSNASQQAWLSHMNQKADAEGFIVIYPESSTSPTSWNSGGGCCDPASAQGVDDRGFIRELLDHAEAKLCVDPARVFATGLSNGGYLANTLACDLDERLAAIGAVAGLLQLDTCAATHPMPVMLVHGTADTLVRYDWLPTTVSFWKTKNGCTTQSTTYMQGSASCVTHSGCTDGADVVVCTIQGGGHQWPGGETVPFLGSNTNDIDATDALWSFFQAHPRR